MRKSARSHLGEPALDLIENAIELLRSTPLSAHLVYHLASVPFVLGLLWFWSDMTRGAFADARLGPESLLLAGLYLLMKTGQAAFSSRLRDTLSNRPVTPWTAGRCLRLFITQAALQPWGFVLIPLSVFPLLMIPFPWLVAFFQGVSAAGDESGGDVGTCLRKAFRQALAWPGQNHAIIPLLLLVGTGVLLDVGIVLGVLPLAAEKLFGITTDFTLTLDAYLNTTFLLSVFGGTYLVLDPLLKALYALRLFQSDSIRTGDDLRARFARLRRARSTAAVGPLLVALLLALVPAPDLRAATPPPAPAAEAAPETTVSSAPSVDPARLQDSIREVLQGSEYTWRAPRERSPDEPEDPTENALVRWIRRQTKALGDFGSRHIGGVGRAIARVLQRLFSGVKPPTLPSGNTEVDWVTGLKLFLYLLLAVGLGAIAWTVYRLWKRRRPRTVTEEAPAPIATPDLRAENVSADLLPEDGWLSLAGEMAGRGEWRLALRALYLASLAHLARRELVRLAPFKSNREYREELGRRARTLPAIPAEFSETALAFERVWYGEHTATPDLFAEVRTRLETIRATGASA